MLEQIALTKVGGHFALDFKCNEIENGIFRVTGDPSNISDSILADLEYHVKANTGFLKSVADNGLSWEQVDTWENWGNGWEWKESRHPLQGKSYRLDRATAWYTSGGKVPSMDSLYEVSATGVKILRSYNRNRQPEFLFYFFPKK